MDALLLPIVGLLINITLDLFFFSKKHILNEETNIYSKLLILGTIFNFIGIITFLVAKLTGDFQIISILQKIYMSILVLLNYSSIIYCFFIFDRSNKFNTFKLILFILTLIFIVEILLLPLNVIFYDNVLDGNGLSYDVTIIYVFISFIFFLILTIYLIWKNSFTKKVIPFVMLVVLYIIGLIIRNVYNELIFEGFFYSYTLLIMFFTIENPDIKIIEMLNYAKQQAEQSNKAKSNFLKNMSHELMTPLNKAVGINSFNIDCRNKDVQENARKVDSILNDITEISRNIIDTINLQSGEIELKNKVYNPTDIFEKVIKLNIDRASDKNIDLKLKIKKELPIALYGDDIKIKQVLMNIVDNAIKYTNKGKVCIIIDNKIEDNNCLLTIKVSDTGIGISPNDIDALFKVFGRIDVDKNITTPGMGLGLAISKQLLDLMNGTIEVESKENVGSQFIVKVNQELIKKEII